jgi:hypothetical protein
VEPAAVPTDFTITCVTPNQGGQGTLACTASARNAVSSTTVLRRGAVRRGKGSVVPCEPPECEPGKNPLTARASATFEESTNEDLLEARLTLGLNGLGERIFRSVGSVQACAIIKITTEEKPRRVLCTTKKLVTLMAR